MAWLDDRWLVHRRCDSQRLVSDGSALHYAEIRADLKKRGALIGANDLLIAAHARALDLSLVTNNTVEFERVRGLAIENWTTPRRRKR
jgi:tRNA(fMet)-specific endonuclease VapC